MFKIFELDSAFFICFKAEPNLAGINPSIATKTIQDGAVLFYPLTDSILRTYHTKPQLNVKINNEVANCATNCDFEWSIDLTPAISSIDISKYTHFYVYLYLKEKNKQKFQVLNQKKKQINK